MFKSIEDVKDYVVKLLIQKENIKNTLELINRFSKTNRKCIQNSIEHYNG